MMTYIPVSGAAPQLAVRGLVMLIDGGTITITGNTGWIYFCDIKGEAFGEQPLLQKAKALEDSLGIERSRYLQLLQEASAARDTAKAREYEKRFNQFYQNHQAQLQLIGAWENEFLRRFPSSPWSVMHYLERATHTPLDSLQHYYARLDSTARHSYYGTILAQEIEKQVRLLPGQDAPAFSFVLPDGTKMRSDDLRGKYLLIYHWGFCPGSFQLEQQICELYTRFSAHLNILGITDNLNSVRKAAETTSPQAKLLGINMKTTLQSMAAHPWYDIEDTGENQQIGKLYAFAGYPFFIFISPEGKICARGFHETFLKAKETLESCIP